MEKFPTQSSNQNEKRPNETGKEELIGYLAEDLVDMVMRKDEMVGKIMKNENFVTFSGEIIVGIKTVPTTTLVLKIENCPKKDLEQTIKNKLTEEIIKSKTPLYAGEKIIKVIRNLESVNINDPEHIAGGRREY